MTSSGDSRPFPIPTPRVNGCDLTPSSTTRFSEHEYNGWRSETGRCQFHTLVTLHTAFLKGPGLMLPWGQQNMHKHLSCTLCISQKFSGECKLGLKCYLQGKICTKYPPVLVQLFCVNFLQGSWHELFQVS